MDNTNIGISLDIPYPNVVHTDFPGLEISITDGRSHTCKEIHYFLATMLSFITPYGIDSRLGKSYKEDV